MCMHAHLHSYTSQDDDNCYIHVKDDVLGRDKLLEYTVVVDPGGFRGFHGIPFWKNLSCYSGDFCEFKNKSSDSVTPLLSCEILLCYSVLD